MVCRRREVAPALSTIVDLKGDAVAASLILSVSTRMRGSVMLGQGVRPHVTERFDQDVTEASNNLPGRSHRFDGVTAAAKLKYAVQRRM